MKKRRLIFLILLVVCMVTLGVTIYIKNENITEYDEETYYIYEEMELGTEKINPSSENYTLTENNNAAESFIQVENIKDSDLGGDESADQYILMAIEEANNQEGSRKLELTQVTQTEQGEKTEEINIDENITNVTEINEQGGDIEFADTMAYKEFLSLGWTDDVDNSLPDDTLVYVVKTYYPNGFEHYKVGTIKNCEAIGVYRADNGEYLGGNFRERAE